MQIVHLTVKLGGRGTLPLGIEPINLILKLFVCIGMRENAKEEAGEDDGGSIRASDHCENPIFS